MRKQWYLLCCGVGSLTSVFKAGGLMNSHILNVDSWANMNMSCFTSKFEMCRNNNL